MTLSTMFYDDELDEVFTTRVQSIENALKNYRNTVEDVTVAKMVLNLPIEVGANPQTWTNTYNKREDGGVILSLELNATW